MKKILLPIAATAVLLTGCAGVATPANGMLFGSVKWDSAIDNNGVAAKKEGKACATSLLGLLATGDASVNAAKASAGITKVANVSHDSMNVLGLYAKYCTVVTGQ